jgi:hypothetical protein
MAKSLAQKYAMMETWQMVTAERVTDLVSKLVGAVLEEVRRLKAHATQSVEMVGFMEAKYVMMEIYLIMTVVKMTAQL